MGSVRLLYWQNGDAESFVGESLHNRTDPHQA